MNVFEDLVTELKEENLLENTFVDVKHRVSNAPSDLEVTDEPNRSYDLYDQAKTAEPALVPAHVSPRTSLKIEMAEEEELELLEVAAVTQAEPEARVESVPLPPKPRNGGEFYQKRAVAEISTLQMVEHVLTGVEREYMKVVPKTFDDFNTKKALNAFLQVTDNENSEQHAEAEFALMRETEAWCSALADRDRNISVSSLRQYCENSRPVLSSQALLAIARFYRNLPYSESVRSKFDFILTRLFSRPTTDDKRVCLFTRDEITTHINKLYREWSSIALYSADDDQSKVLLTALSFEDLAVEAENAGSFDQLISTDYFGRLRLFKESVAELFYAPNVTSAAIETNVRVGNAYVTLIDRERRKMDDESIQSKYGDLHDDSVSEATSRTLDLVELLRSRPEPYEPVEESIVGQEVEQPEEPQPELELKKEPKKAKIKVRSPLVRKLLDNLFSVNRWFLAVAGLLVAASVGIYIYSNFFLTENLPAPTVSNFSLDNTGLGEHLSTAKLSGENFYGLLLPSWDALTKEKRQEFLHKTFQTCKEKGCTQVNLLTKDGKVAAYASATRSDVVMP